MKTEIPTSVCPGHGIYPIREYKREDSKTATTHVPTTTNDDAGTHWYKGHEERNHVSKHTVDQRVEKPAKVWTTDTIRAEWYKVIHDIVPTNVHLARINLSDTDRCRLCGRCDTLIHRLTVRIEMKDIWDWTRRRIGLILHTDPTKILPEWTIMPSFDVWPPQRRRAILWVLAHTTANINGPSCR